MLSTSGYVATVAPLAADPVVRATVRTTIDEEVSLVISAEFQRLWTAANTAVHGQIVSVLNGSSTAVATTGNQVVLNLVPLITAVLKDISGPLSRLTGETITPPTISAVPATACRQIASLAHTRLPADCGQIPLFPASALTRARLAFRLLSAGTLALVIRKLDGEQAEAVFGELRGP